MSEKQFILCQDDLGNYEIRYDDKVFHFLWEVAPILNEQQDTINKLKKARDESDKFIVKKGLGAEFLEWCVENDE